MIGWLIFGGIVFVLIVIFVQTVTVTAVYDSHPEIVVKFLWFTIMRSPPDPDKKKKKKKKKNKKAKASKPAKSDKQPIRPDIPGKEETPAGEGIGYAPFSPDLEPKKAAENDKAEKISMIKDYVESSWEPVKKMLKNIKIRDVYIDYVVGADDAAVTALKYGGICAAVYSVTEWLKTYFDTQIREINIEADFDAQKDDPFVYVTLKMKLFTFMWCSEWLLLRASKTTLKYKAGNKMKKKPASGKR